MCVGGGGVSNIFYNLEIIFQEATLKNNIGQPFSLECYMIDLARCGITFVLHNI